jgi:small GTP-binding protein
MNAKDIDTYKYKICVIGNGEVGKTSLIRKYTNKSFQEKYIKTIGAQFSIHEKRIADAQVRVIIWDIAGQDEFGFMRSMFYKGSRAAIIVYSLEMNDLGKKSFDNVKEWNAEILKFCGKIPTAIFANKVDIAYENVSDRPVLKDLIDNDRFFGYFVTSAKTGEGVENAFNAFIDQVFNELKDDLPKNSS